MKVEPRVYRLRWPARWIARVAPVWLTVVALGLIAMSFLLVVSVVTDENRSGSSLVLVAVGLAAFWTVVAMLWRPSLSLVREVRELGDGRLELTTIFGRTRSVGPGDVLEVREQFLVPQPGSTRVRIREGSTFYLWTFEDKYELVDRFRELRREE